MCVLCDGRRSGGRGVRREGFLRGGPEHSPAPNPTAALPFFQPPRCPAGAPRTCSEAAERQATCAARIRHTTLQADGLPRAGGAGQGMQWEGGRELLPFIWGLSFGENFLIFFEDFIYF